VIRLKVVRTEDVEIDSKESTCSPCRWLDIRMADSWRKGNARCHLFGKDLDWPKTVGDIERVPECLRLDGSADGTVVTLTRGEL
jgi:hypothetical protein